MRREGFLQVKTSEPVGGSASLTQRAPHGGARAGVAFFGPLFCPYSAKYLEVWNSANFACTAYSGVRMHEAA
jgi:hypothetical protein